MIKEGWLLDFVIVFRLVRVLYCIWIVNRVGNFQEYKNIFKVLGKNLVVRIFRKCEEVKLMRYIGMETC